MKRLRGIEFGLKESKLLSLPPLEILENQNSVDAD
jgi:hypothetical protein